MNQHQQRPPDVIVHHVTKETDAVTALRGSRGSVARNALRGFREKTAQNVLMVTTEITAVMILFYLTNCPSKPILYSIPRQNKNRCCTGDVGDIVNKIGTRL